ncbi:alpha/beta hydrolase [Chloroflexota bacterium]
MRLIKRWWWIVPVLLIVAGVGFIMWASGSAEPMPEALAALESDDTVFVDTEPWLTFWPVADAAETGFIVYPGGEVDARAYAPLAQAIAAQGYPTIIVPMPLNLAVFAPGKASDVMAHFPDVEQWVVGGHSLGGAMAANFAYSQPDDVDGLVLWAAYPAESNDLSSRDLAVVSIYGDLDGLATVDKIEAARALLPTDAQYVPITGGNHAQFGWYGSQGGDNSATITRFEQQEQIVDTTVALLNDIQAD